MLPKATELANLQVFLGKKSHLTDSNRRPPPYHGGFELQLCEAGKALDTTLCLQSGSFLSSLLPSLEGP
jgi:hypothetical protein